jgi:hypothetical protein
MSRKTAVFWDIHEASASKRSKRWAVTDRGWLFHACRTALGHYLDYGPCPYSGADRSPDGNVHAVIIPHSTHTNASGQKCCQCGPTRDSRYFRTTSEARAWIEKLSNVSNAAEKSL